MNERRFYEAETQGLCRSAPAALRNREPIAEVLAEHTRPLHIHEIASRLGLTEGAYEPLRRVLDDLCWDGSVVALPGQRFRLARAREERERRGREHEGSLNVNPRGFGFVTVLDLPDDV